MPYDWKPLRASPRRVCRGLVLAASSPAARGADLSGLLVGVTDGDTVEVLVERGADRVSNAAAVWGDGAADCRSALADRIGGGGQANRSMEGGGEMERCMRNRLQ